MKVWVVMRGNIRNSTGILSIHRSMATAFGAALRHTLNSEVTFDDDWRLDPFMMSMHDGVRVPHWCSGMEECWIEEREVVD